MLRKLIDHTPRKLPVCLPQLDSAIRVYGSREAILRAAGFDPRSYARLADAVAILTR